jgi:predicted ATPase
LTLRLINSEPLPRAIAETIGLPNPRGDPAGGWLGRMLDSHCVLRLLDNVEHLLPGAASLIAGLLGAVPGIRVLASSREPLRLSCEHVVQVRPLAVPSGGKSAF